MDVGGTASRWVACETGGNILARGEVGGATAHVFNPAERARLAGMLDQLARALAEAGLAANSLVAGFTGFGAAAAADISDMAGTALGIVPETVLVSDDIVLAYAAHFQPGQGHLISAGTGSIGIHVTKAGETIRVGGRGILIDDAGSGSWIALRALDHIYRVLDRQGDFAGVELLAEHLFALVGGRDWHDVRQYIYAGDRGRIGALALGVAQAAEAGDAAALDILRGAGAELAGLAFALLKRAGPEPVAAIGGVLQLHSIIAKSLIECLPGAEVTRPAIDTALAAARLRPGQAWHSLLSTSAAKT
nr:BadF/BadG/BcrA/BcrD ATPase family protein [Devosia faecipullorum]